MSQNKLINVYINVQSALNALSQIESRALDSIRKKLSDAMIELGGIISPDKGIRTAEELSRTSKRCFIAADGPDPINIFEIPVEAIDPYYTAKTLSNILRFNSKTELTVAEHCVNMAQYFLDSDLPNKKELAIRALTHEIAEQFTGDVATPLKDIQPEIRILENDLLKRYWEHIGLNGNPPDELHDIDKRIMFAEAKKYYSKFVHWDKYQKEGGYKDYDGVLPDRPLLRREAMYKFAKMWKQLGLPLNEKLEDYLAIEGMVSMHEKWLMNKQDGEQADFSFFKIEDYSFEGRNLEMAIFTGTTLIVKCKGKIHQ